MSYAYGWGANYLGQLGLQVGENDYYSKPIYLNTFPTTSPIADIGCGENHSITVLQDGTVHSFGSNEFGQLGRSGFEPHPLLVDALRDNAVQSTSCGKYFSLVLTRKGQVFSWGQNNEGQLGRLTESDFDQSPRIVKSLTFFEIVQISCGHNHSLALSETRKIFSWGSNLFWQLANSSENFSSIPTQILDLSFIPVSFISCGGTHSFALSVSGAVFSWGNNQKGQLGFPSPPVKKFPTQLNISNNHRVVFVSCGNEHSALLTQDGGVFTFGGGRFGCLGHGTTSDQFVPMMVQFLMGIRVSQLVCGSHCTFAFVPQQKIIYSWGFNQLGQLGHDDYNNKTLPSISSISSKIGAKNNEFSRMFSKFNQVFAIFNNFPTQTIDERQISKNFPFLSLNCADIIAMGHTKDESALFSYSSHFEAIFSSVSCLNASFLTESLIWGEPSTGPNVDFCLVSTFMTHFSHLSSSFQLMIYSVTSEWLDNLSSFKCPDSCFEGLRFVMILLHLPCFVGHKTADVQNLFINLLKCFDVFSRHQIGVIVSWYSNVYVQFSVYALGVTKDFLVEQFKIDGEKSKNSLLMLNFLSILYKSNILSANSPTKESINPREFYIDNLSSLINIKEDYLSKYFKIIKIYYLFDYPFIYTMEDKVMILNFHDDLVKQIAVTDHVIANFAANRSRVSLSNPAAIFFTLRVSRDWILEDTIDAFRNANPANMRRPLYVIFTGEDAMDYGGVRKEFFMLLFDELLDSKYGLFEEDGESRLIWFCQDTQAGNYMFNLAGILCGLCIYNNIIVNLPFPPSLYKKLLGRRVYLPDLAILNPSLGRGLKALLDYDGDDFEDLFMLTFQISAGKAGKLVDLRENAENVAVTNQNKSKYVDLYVDYILNTSIDSQYRKFEKGFRTVVEFKILEHFDPLELESLIVGRQNYNFEEWERHAGYDGEYHAHHPVIMMFWRVFHSLDIQQKKNFLLFLTGSDRIPFSGLKSVPITIQPCHVDEDHLPVAHTCFNLLDLPVYSTEEVMRTKLLASIEHTKGFGLI